MTGWTSEEFAEGALLATDAGLFGPGGRSDYIPEPGGNGWYIWNGDTF
ncbi:hypothetical protein [Streptomyces toxytricini]